MDTPNKGAILDLEDDEVAEEGKAGCCPCGKSSRKKPTAIPWRVLFILFFPLFSSCYSITYIFPYVPNMVLHFGYAEEDKGYYAGIIAAAFFLGRILGSYFWGWLSDRRGRKPIIIICLLLVTVSNLTFGFMPNIWSASFARVLVGLFNGLMPIIKSVIYEISDDTNQAWCMSLIALAWGIGTIVGPLISGFLAQPVDKYPHVFADNGAFGQFPFLLPSLVAAVICVLTLFPVICGLQETSNKKRVIEEMEVKLEPSDEQDTLLATNEPVQVPPSQEPNQRHSLLLVSRPKLQRSASDSDPGTDELSPLPWPEDNDICFIDSVYTDEYSKVYGYGLVPGSHGSLYDVDLYPTMAGKRKSWRISFTGSLTNSRSMRSLQKSKSLKSFTVFTPDGTKSNLAFPESLLDLSLYQIPNGNILPAHSVILSESDKIHIPPKHEKPAKKNCCREISCFRILRSKDVCMSVFLYAIYAFAVIGYEEIYTVWASTEQSLGGLGFDSSQIGKAVGLGAIPLVVVNIFLFPVLEARFGAKKTFCVFCVVLIIFTVLTPCLRFLEDGSTSLWALILFVSAMTKIAGCISFASIAFFINNSASPEDIGKVNGIGMVFTAVGRFFAPLVGGSAYAWSISHGVHIGFPLDVNFAFFLFGLAYLASNILAALLPASVDKQKKSPREVDVVQCNK